MQDRNIEAMIGNGVTDEQARKAIAHIIDTYREDFGLLENLLEAVKFYRPKLLKFTAENILWRPSADKKAHVK